MVAVAPGMPWRQTNAMTSEARAATAAVATGRSVPQMRPQANPAATASRASSTPSGRVSRPAALISDQIAHAARIRAPAASDAFASSGPRSARAVITSVPRPVTVPIAKAGSGRSAGDWRTG